MEDRTRRVPFSVALEKGHALAQWHRSRHDAPDRDAWRDDFRTFTSRTEGQYSPRDLELIRHHAEALLGYDGRCKAEQPGLWAPEPIRRWFGVTHNNGGEHGGTGWRRRAGGTVPAHR